MSNPESPIASVAGPDAPFAYWLHWGPAGDASTPRPAEGIVQAEREEVEARHDHVTFLLRIDYQAPYTRRNDVASGPLTLDLERVLHRVCFEDPPPTTPGAPSAPPKPRKEYEHLMRKGLLHENFKSFLGDCYLHAVDVHHHATSFPMSLTWEFRLPSGERTVFVQPHHPDIRTRESELIQSPEPVALREPLAMVLGEFPEVPSRMGRHRVQSLRDELEALLSTEQARRGEGEIRVTMGAPTPPPSFAPSSSSSATVASPKAPPKGATANAAAVVDPDRRLYLYLRDLCEYFWTDARLAASNLAELSQSRRRRVEFDEKNDGHVWLLHARTLRQAYRFAYGDVPSDAASLARAFRAPMGVSRLEIRVETFDPELRSRPVTLSNFFTRRRATLYVRVSVLVLVDERR